jgi:hypothetical protein
MTLIPPDLSRCRGEDHEAKCQQCARRRQREQDDPRRWFPQMLVEIRGGRCDYHIPVLPE